MTTVQDTFTRANVASGWGTASDGNTWTIQSGNGQSVSSNEGQISGSTASTFATLGSARATADVEGVVRFRVEDPAHNTAGILLRWTDSNNHWLGRYDGANGSFNVMVKVSGTYTSQANITASLASGNSYWIRFRCQGSTISIRYWQEGTSEPSSWTAQYTSLTSQDVAGQAGLYGYAGGNLTLLDSFQAYDLTSALTWTANDGETLGDALAETLTASLGDAATLGDGAALAYVPTSLSDSLEAGDALAEQVTYQPPSDALSTSDIWLASVGGLAWAGADSLSLGESSRYTLPVALASAVADRVAPRDATATIILTLSLADALGVGDALALAYGPTFSVEAPLALAEAVAWVLAQIDGDAATLAERAQMWLIIALGPDALTSVDSWQEVATAFLPKFLPGTITAASSGAPSISALMSQAASITTALDGAPQLTGASRA